MATAGGGEILKKAGVWPSGNVAGGGSVMKIIENQ
jgi:hypothetical protein